MSWSWRPVAPNPDSPISGRAHCDRGRASVKPVSGGDQRHMDQSVITPREIMPGAVVAPTPPWVDLAPYAIPAVANPHFIAGGLCSLLDDAQVDLCGPERAWYCRHAELVTAPAGAERAAQFSVS